jgi:hypothetical protein
LGQLSKLSGDALQTVALRSWGSSQKLSGLGAALRGSQVCNASPSSEVLRILLSKLSGLEDLAEGLEELLAVSA